MQGYHPEIVGVMSKDGETVTFEEVMKARLGVDHWVKCIGLHVRATLRYLYMMAITFPLKLLFSQNVFFSLW